MVTPCQHPASRLYTWRTYDDTLAVACCDCGAALKGATTVDDYTIISAELMNAYQPPQWLIELTGERCNADELAAINDCEVTIHETLAGWGEYTNVISATDDHGITRWYAAEIRP